MTATFRDCDLNQYTTSMPMQTEVLDELFFGNMANSATTDRKGQAVGGEPRTNISAW